MTAWEALKDAPRRIGQAAGAARPELKLIRTPTRRLAVVPFGVLMVVLLGLGTIGLLLLNTTLQNQAFEVRSAQRQAAELSYIVSDLQSQAYAAESPGELAQRATELGMVPNPHGVFVDLRTGTVVGDATPVTGNEMPGLLVRPEPAQPAPEGLDAAPAAAQPGAEDPGTASPDTAEPATPVESTAAATDQPDTGDAAGTQTTQATTQEANP